MSKRSALQKLNDLIYELEIATQNFEFDVISTSSSSSENKIEEKIEEKYEEKIESKIEAKVEAKVEVKEKKAKASKSDSPKISSNEVNINHIDLRVGVIVSVQRHPDAEKLYTEEIDVGEESPRKIASGLVPFYTLEEMQGKKLIVVCNLKPRNLVGFKSHGMVLCASRKDPNGVEKDIVEFVDPPIGSKPGDRIFGEGLSGEPLTPNQLDKQKAFDLVAPDLKVDSNGIACWRGSRLVTSTGEGCTVPTLRDAPIH